MLIPVLAGALRSAAQEPRSVAQLTTARTASGTPMPPPPLTPPPGGFPGGGNGGITPDAHTLQTSFAGQNTAGVTAAYAVRQVTMTFVQPSFTAPDGFGNDIIWPGIQSSGGGFFQAGTYLNQGGPNGNGVPFWFYWATCSGCTNPPVYGGPVTPGHKIYAFVGYSSVAAQAHFVIQDKTAGTTLVDTTLSNLPASKYYNGAVDAEWLLERSCTNASNCAATYLPLEKFAPWTYTGTLAFGNGSGTESWNAVAENSVVMSDGPDNGNESCSNPNLVSTIIGNTSGPTTVEWCKSR